MITLISMSIFVFIASIDQFSGLEVLYQPLISATILGSILGNIEIGFRIGILLQLITIGHFPVGGHQPPNRLLYTIGAVFLGILVFTSTPELGIIVAYPMGWLGQKITTMIFKWNDRYYKQAINLIEKRQLNRIYRLAFEAIVILGSVYVFVTLSLYGLIVVLKPQLILLTPFISTLHGAVYMLVFFGVAQLYNQVKSKNGWILVLVSILVTVLLTPILNQTYILFIILTVGGYLTRHRHTNDIAEEGI